AVPSAAPAGGRAGGVFSPLGWVPAAGLAAVVGLVLAGLWPFCSGLTFLDRPAGLKATAGAVSPTMRRVRAALCRNRRSMLNLSVRGHPPPCQRGTCAPKPGRTPPVARLFRRRSW